MSDTGNNLIPSGNGIGQIVSDAIKAIDKATEPALTYAAEKAGQLAGAALSAIPFIGELLGGITEKITSSKGGMDSGFQLPAVPQSSSVQAQAQAPSVQLSIDAGQLPQVGKSQARGASEMTHVDPGDLCTFPSPLTNLAQAPQVGGHSMKRG